MSEAPETMVRFDDAGVTYRDGTRVLDGFTLALEPGEVLALVGRSGAGKSTALKLVNRLLLPTTGRVLVDGRDTREWDGIRLRRRIGYVLQDVGLFPHMSVAENVGLIPRIERWARDRIRARVDELLELVGLAPATYRDRRPHELSGGQRQRVGVARALALNPPVLLMDEPFGALDPVTRLEVRTAFVRIQQALGTTVLVVTHDLAEAFALATRIGVMDAGRLVQCDRPAAIARATDGAVRQLMETVPQTPAPDGVS